MTPPLAQVLWQSPDRVPIAVAIAALVASVVLWLYPPQTRGVPAPWRWVMPGLRGLAAAALVVALIRPVVLRPRTATREGPIVVLVDRSRSMSIRDGGDRAPAEQVALAAGLGALPGGDAARPEVAPALRGQLDAIRAGIDQVARARSEAEYARLAERGAAAAAARLREAGERLRTAVAALSDAQPVPELQQRVAALKAAPPQFDDAALRALRAATDAAGKALATAQGQADEKLYRDDAGVRAACDRLAALPRDELVEAALTREPAGGLMARLPAGVAVQGMAFADEVSAIGDGLSRGGRGVGGGLNLNATGPRSDLAGALRAALRLSAPGGRLMTAIPPQAIVLVSDGRQVGGDGEGLLSDLTAAGVPVFAIAAASTAGPRRDLSVVRVDAPVGGRAGQTILVRVDVRGVGLHGETAEVRLQAGHVLQIRRVKFGGDEPPAAASAVNPITASAEFDVQLAQPGPLRLGIDVQPLPGEATRENNRFDRWVKVGPDPAKVMVIAGATAGRQYASLHAALSPPPWVALREVDEPGQYAALSTRSILDQDVIVLIDLPVDDLNDDQWAALGQAVRERAKTVILCAGQRLPGDYADHAGAEAFLPYEPSDTQPTWRTWPGGEAQFRVAPSAEWEALAAAGSNAIDRAFWRQLPPLSRMLPLTRLRSEVRPVLVERDGGAAVMTEATMGLGRVYFIATDQSWRWRGPGGAGSTGGGTGGGTGGAAAAAREREQFWPHLVRLAAGEPYAAARGDLRLDVDDLAPQPQQAINVRARVLDPYGQPIDAAAQTLHVLQDGSRVREVALATRGGRSGLFEGSIDGLPAGDYVLRLDAPEDPTQEIPPDPVELPLRVAPRFEAELADLSGDTSFLGRIANASGGQFFTIDQIGALPGRLEENRRKLAPLVEYALWDSPYLFAFVLACLSAEWALRKKYGLA